MNFLISDPQSACLLVLFLVAAGHFEHKRGRIEGACTTWYFAAIVLYANTMGHLALQPLTLVVTLLWFAAVLALLRAYQGDAHLLSRSNP